MTCITRSHRIPKRPSIKNYAPPKEHAYPYKRGWTNGRVGYPCDRNPWFGINRYQAESLAYDQGWMDATGKEIPATRKPYRPKPIEMPVNFLNEIGG